jgi:hypothetical protein
VSDFVLIATNMGEAMVHAGPGCRDVVLTDSKNPTRGKTFAVDEIRVTDTALDDPAFPTVMAAVIAACPPVHAPTVHPLFAGILHAVPPAGSNRTPCCNRPVLDHPRTDRITTSSALVTCRRYTAVIEDQLGIELLPWQRDYLDHYVAARGLNGRPTEQTNGGRP